MLGVEGELLSGLSLDKPSKLHDRTSSRVEDGPLDLVDVSFHAVAVSGDDG